MTDRYREALEHILTINTDEPGPIDDDHPSFAALSLSEALGAVHIVARGALASTEPEPADVEGVHGYDDAPPILPCLLCGHEQPLACYQSVHGQSVGVCEGCRDLAAANRGPCSPARDCACWHREMQREDR